MSKNHLKIRSAGTSTRRQFLKQSSLALGSTVIASSLFSKAFAATAGNSTREHTLVFVFLKGGADALSILAPTRRSSNRVLYEGLRPTGHLPLTSMRGLEPSGEYGLNEAAESLVPLYQQSKMGLFLNVGCENPTTSHFSQQDNIEFGYGRLRDTSAPGGFLNRALSGMNDDVKSSIMPAVSIDTRLAKSLAGRETAVAFSSFNANKMPELPKVRNGLSLTQRLQAMFISTERDELAIDRLLRMQGVRARRVSSAMDEVQTLGKKGNPDPASFADAQAYGPHKSFMEAVRALKIDPKLRFLTINVNGWDDHVNLGSTGEGRFANRLRQLSSALAAFTGDLEANSLLDKVTIVVMSEFGRRVEENSAKGLDHGRGGLAMVIGAQVKKQIVDGGLDLSPEGLVDGNLPVNIDYRKIFAEVLTKKMGLSNVYQGSATDNSVSAVFPGLETANPVKIF